MPRPYRQNLTLSTLLFCIVCLLVACTTPIGAQQSPPAPLPAPVPAPTPAPVPEPVPVERVTIAAAGDIACSPSDGNYNSGDGLSNYCGMKATSDLILSHSVDAVLALGDLQYSQGRLGAFEASYDPTWGRFKAITYPAPGNHEYYTADASGYYSYFGQQAGDPAKGYYSFNLADWHLVALNSNCDAVGGCGEGSAQLEWLQADLAANPSTCTLAYWHHPRFSSGPHGSDPITSALWDTLQAAGATLVLSGHDHSYERFALQTSAGDLATAGLRQFVVGTGGIGFYDEKQLQAHSEVLIQDEFGVLFLTLEPASYTWSFESIAGEVLDAGTENCIR